MNPIVITIVIATATFILSIFGALQFYSSRMEKYIDAKVDGLRGEMRAEFAGLRGEMNARFGEVNARLSALDDRIGRVERQLEAIFKPVLPPGRGD